ncbi:hypothetical protein VIGAN_05213600 [Vigna angularis var. angularis]|uniref:Uncharacterized protein n=1 Tax=Vigna angularis var. angularis TaxID=157739 RepID=A0A0S3S6Y3_PHAAN|nr:hypothetical protein VIGAN_05213600 [Vigna angularis var. angularis]
MNALLRWTCTFMLDDSLPFQDSILFLLHVRSCSSKMLAETSPGRCCCILLSSNCWTRAVSLLLVTAPKDHPLDIHALLSFLP